MTAEEIKDQLEQHIADELLQMAAVIREEDAQPSGRPSAEGVPAVSSPLDESRRRLRFLATQRLLA